MRYHTLCSRVGVDRQYMYRPPPRHKIPALLHVSALVGAEQAAKPLPDSVDLRAHCLPIRNQGLESACSGFSTAAFREAALAIAGTPVPSYLSPAYLYGRTRIAEGTFPRDSGAWIADEFAILHGYGVCPESFLPYHVDPAEEPTPACDVAAMPFRCSTPLAVDYGDPVALKTVLAAGKPIVIGFQVHPSFESTGGSGEVPTAGDREPLLGGHAVLLVGYTPEGQWIIRNSWGAGWAALGYCFMPAGYEALWFDAWTA